ncbi:MAG: UTP--glucose-1-phosphate uridylyltransferase, partial [Anaerolineae bacterium]
FFDPIQTIIPWASNLYTETLIDRVEAAFPDAFWGFWMLGGASGSGMGFIFDPRHREMAQARLQEIMLRTKRQLQYALPFAIEPVVYDFAINGRGTWASLLEGEAALMPPGYYTLTVPDLLRQDRYALSPARRAELDRFAAACRTQPELSGMVQTLFDQLLPRTAAEGAGEQSLEALLDDLGFDRIQHDQIRSDLRSGRIGLAQNRLPASTAIDDVEPDDVADLSGAKRREDTELTAIGLDALREGMVAVVSLAAGVGSRWTQGAGVVKPLHPFCKLGGIYRTFIEVHLAKSRRVGRMAGTPIPHVITTSYL